MDKPRLFKKAQAMQQSNAPSKIVLPFAASGGKNTIPTDSQVGITPGAASLADGFPPLTRTPLSGGGVPPSGLDMNGILFEASAIVRWACSGAGFHYDATFATNTNVGGYPEGALVLRSDNLGYWLNTQPNNTTDPESAGSAAAGWVPYFTQGVATVAMASANVTLTPLQYGKPIIVLTGTLTANLNLIFPTIGDEWIVINGTTGAFTVTCKTAAGAGVVAQSAMQIVCDGTDIKSVSNSALSQYVQVGKSATAGHNFTFDASADDGTMALYKGNAGAAITNVMTVDTASKPDFPQLVRSLGNSGEYELPGGLLLKWGITAPVVSDVNVTVTFTTPFPNACFVVIPTAVNSNANVDNFATFISKSATNIVLARAFIAGTTGETNPLLWVAIGN